MTAILYQSSSATVTVHNTLRTSSTIEWPWYIDALDKWVDWTSRACVAATFIDVPHAGTSLILCSPALQHSVWYHMAIKHTVFKFTWKTNKCIGVKCALSYIISYLHVLVAVPSQEYWWHTGGSLSYCISILVKVPWWWLQQWTKHVGN